MNFNWLHSLPPDLWLSERNIFSNLQDGKFAVKFWTENMNTKVVNAGGLEQEGGYFINSWNLMLDWQLEGEQGLQGLCEWSWLWARHRKKNVVSTNCSWYVAKRQGRIEQVASGGGLNKRRGRAAHVTVMWLLLPFEGSHKGASPRRLWTMEATTYRSQ